MLTKAEFGALIETQGSLTLDGALATELEARGEDLNHPLWSANTLQHNPESIAQVHLDYYLAGADVGITASYQASIQGLKEHFGMSENMSVDLIKKSVQLAQNARTEAYRKGVHVDHKLLVAGSVGPYGAYLANGSEYTGDYDVTPEAIKDFHRPRIQALIDAGADILAFETMPNVSEIQALSDILREEFSGAIAWLSCTIKSPERLSDGTPWKRLLTVVNKCAQIVAFGINCVPLSMASETLTTIRSYTELPLVCYPNSGETWDAVSKTWHGQRLDKALDSQIQGTTSAGLDQIAVEVNNWTAAGAKLVGGCCRTGPLFIKAMSKRLRQS